MNWSFLLLRITIALSILTLLYLSQRFWYRSLWRVTSHWGRLPLRVGTRLAYVILLLLVIVTMAQGLIFGRGGFARQSSMMTVLTGLWFFSALFAFLAVKTVHGLERLWRLLRAATCCAPQPRTKSSHSKQPHNPRRTPPRPSLIQAVAIFSAPPRLRQALLHSSAPCTVSPRSA